MLSGFASHSGKVGHRGHPYGPGRGFSSPSKAPDQGCSE